MIDYSNIKQIKRTHQPWISQNFDKYGLGGYKTAGQIMKYLWKYNPNNIQEFLIKYLGAKTRYSKFENVVLRIKKIKQCDLQEAIDITFIGIFYNSYLGYKAEIEAIRYLENKYNVNVEKADSKMDNKYAVDLFIKEENKVFGAIQVKSDGSRYNNTTNYQKRNRIKNNAFTLETGIKVQYLYYYHEYNPDKLDFNIWFELKDAPKRLTWEEMKSKMKNNLATQG